MDARDFFLGEGNCRRRRQSFHLIKAKNEHIHFILLCKHFTEVLSLHTPMAVSSMWWHLSFLCVCCTYFHVVFFPCTLRILRFICDDQCVCDLRSVSLVLKRIITKHTSPNMVLSHFLPNHLSRSWISLRVFYIKIATTMWQKTIYINKSISKSQSCVVCQ